MILSGGRGQGRDTRRLRLRCSPRSELGPRSDDTICGASLRTVAFPGPGLPDPPHVATGLRRSCGAACLNSSRAIAIRPVRISSLMPSGRNRLMIASIFLVSPVISTV